MKQAIDYFKNNKVKVITLILYWLFCLISLIYFAIKGETFHALTSVGFMLLTLIPILLEFFKLFRLNNFLTITLAVLCAVGLLGTSYNLYTVIPFFDDILHTLSGIIFAELGYLISDIFFKDDDTNKTFIGKLIFAFSFSLAIGFIWELIEWASYNLFGLDMEEDSLITWFNSYYITGSHDHATNIDSVTKTVIYYNDGLVQEIEGGYLDIGLIDTLTDMLVCFIGTICYLVYKIIYRVIYNKRHHR